MTTNTEIPHLVDINLSEIIYKPKPKDPKDQSLLQTIYVNYKSERQPLIFQTSPIEILGIGTGYTHPKHVNDEKDKLRLRLPIINDKSSEDKLNEWNNFAKSTELKKTLFDKAMNKYKLNPIIRFSEDNEDKPPNITVKIDINKDSKTRIFNGINEDNELLYDTIDEFQKIVCYRSTCIYILNNIYTLSSQRTDAITAIYDVVMQDILNK